LRFRLGKIQLIRFLQRTATAYDPEENFFLLGQTYQAGAAMSSTISNIRPKPDNILVGIADYVMHYPIDSSEAYQTARLCLMDTLGCGLEALGYPACTKLLGPIVPGTVVPHG